MSKNLLASYQIEIQDLLNKKLIRPNKCSWSCSEFYVNKALEIERGTHRLVISLWLRSYNGLDIILLIKKAYLNCLYEAKNFSKFNLKLGFLQIQIKEEERYKIAFNVRLGQFECNVMPFGLKNAPSEF